MTGPDAWHSLQTLQCKRKRAWGRDHLVTSHSKDILSVPRVGMSSPPVEKSIPRYKLIKTLCLEDTSTKKRIILYN